ncbi:MAG: hypothetical protein RJA70_2770 [Pseudomonadota bacterium]
MRPRPEGPNVAIDMPAEKFMGVEAKVHQALESRFVLTGNRVEELPPTVAQQRTSERP